MESVFRKIINESLKAYRKETKITQIKASELLGVSQPYYQVLESGQTDVTLKQLFRVCKGLDKSNQLFLLILMRIIQEVGKEENNG